MELHRGVRPRLQQRLRRLGVAVLRRAQFDQVADLRAFARQQREMPDARSLTYSIMIESSI